MIQKPPHGANPPQDSFIDFSSNLHPSPPPEIIVNAALSGIARSARYPDASAEPIRAAYSERLDMPSGQILVGPGSSSLLYQILFVFKPATVLIPTPCFSEYEYAAKRAGARVVECPADSAVPSQLPPHTVVLLSNPCNPTGRLLPPDVLRLWMQTVRNSDGFLIVDEAYADFREDGPDRFSRETFDSFPLIVLRSPLKFFSLPGLRAGLVLLPAKLAERVEADLPPWPLSTPALSALMAVLSLDEQELRDRRRRVRNWADTFHKALLTVPDISIHPSDVHFFLIRLPASGPDGPTLSAGLARDGMWIRTHAGMPGLTPHDIRVSTRLPEENGKLIIALKKIYAGAGTAA